MSDKIVPLPKPVEGEYLDGPDRDEMRHNYRAFCEQTGLISAHSTKPHVWNYDFYSCAATCSRCGYVRYSLNAATPACR